jgi:RNA polymerase sigma-70 factor (ECF subfamily)
MTNDENARADFEALVDAVRRGDEAAWNDLVARHRDALLRLAKHCLGFAGGVVDASDVVQDALLKALLKREGLRAGAEEELLAWLKAIVRAGAIDAVRGRLRQKRDAGRNRPIPEDSDGELALPAADTSPSLRAARREEEDTYQSRLQQLTEVERKTIQLHVTQGLDWPEVAQQLGITAAAAKQKYFRAVRRLRNKGAGDRP